MKRKKVRNTFFALIKLFPFVYLIFLAVFLNNHVITEQEITVSDNVVLNFNQQMINRGLSNSSWSTYNFYSTSDYRYLSSNNDNVSHTIARSCILTLNTQHTYLLYSSSNFFYIGLSSSQQNQKTLFVPTTTTGFNFWYHWEPSFTDNNIYFLLIDLSYLFDGTTYAPTIQNYETFFNYDFQPFISSKSVVKQVSTSTKSNEGILEQATYELYNVVEDNFNFKDFFGFNQFYDWTLATFFNGNAPTIWLVVFNLLIYEVFIDILLLLYCFITFIVDFAYKLLDSFYGKENNL